MQTSDEIQDQQTEVLLNSLMKDLNWTAPLSKYDIETLFKTHCPDRIIRYYHRHFLNERQYLENMADLLEIAKRNTDTKQTEMFKAVVSYFLLADDKKQVMEILSKNIGTCQTGKISVI